MNQKYTKRCKSSRLITLLIMTLLFIGNIATAQINRPGVAPVQIPAGGFGVDGDALANYPTPGDYSEAGDWFSDPLYPGSGGTIFDMSTPDPFDLIPALLSPVIMAKHYNDPYAGTDPTRFLTSNKINDDPNTYQWGPGGTNNPAKNEINNATVAFSFGDPNLGGNVNDLWAIIAGDRATVNGSSYIDFEFLQNSLTMTGVTSGGFLSTGPDGGRTLGDALITLEFINGGVIAEVVINIWSLVNGTYKYVPQDINNYTGQVFSTANLVVTTAPWMPFGQSQYMVNQYAEAAINLSAIFGFSPTDCGYISTVFVRTRTSGNSSSSELTDLPGEPFQVNISTEDLEVTCPTPVSLTACTASATITTSYNTWAAGFTVTGTHNPQSNLAELPALPADVNCNGANLTFSLSATDDCETQASCSSTFFVAADVPVDATCAEPVNITDPCTALADIQIAYTNWVAGFSYTGGCNPTTNIGTIPALPANVDCSGANLTFTYSVTSDCGSDWCTSTFVVAADVPADATCAAPVNITNACTPLADIQTAYNSWVAGFTNTGGCGTTTNIGSIPALPANVDCSGASLTFTYSVTSHCSTDWCASTFNVAADVPVDATCAAPVNITNACTPLADIQTAYNSWVAGFTNTGGCGTTTNIGSIPALPANVDCNGANLTFTYSVTSHCSTDWCMSTFKVAADVPVDATCAAPVNITNACTPLADIQTAYNSWVAGFSSTGGCGTTTNIGSIPALPANVDCSGANLTFTYSVTSHCSTDWCMSTFKVAADVPVDATCAAPVNITNACTPLADIQTAYNSWVAGFSSTGGCGTTTNIGSIPALPANVDCSGANLTFTYSVTSHCSTDWCMSTFKVAADVPVDATCAAPVNITNACTPLADIQTAYNSWVAGFSSTGGCGTTTNIGSIPALPANVDCSGANLTFTYSVTSHCSTDWCMSTFKVAADVPVDATCAAPVNITDACTPLADIQTAYNSWVAGFSSTGGCGTTTNIGSIPALPANVDCSGANLTFTYSVTSHCSTDWCVSTFKVAADVPVDATCAAPVNITNACTPLADIQTAYNSWVAGFSSTGGCGTTTNIGSIPALPANVDCSGANLTFTYSVTSHCSTDWCMSTFKVAADVPVDATCSAPVNITDACTPLADIQTAYNSWVAGFSSTGGCGTTTNIGSIPALPANVDCSGANLTFTYSVTSHCSTDWCMSTFKVAADVPVDATCAAPVNLSACTSLTDITTAYNNWVAGFSSTGGCGRTTNIGSIPALPANADCLGANLTFTYSVTSHCSTDWCVSTFIVAPDDEDPTLVTTLEDLTFTCDETVTIPTVEFTDNCGTVETICEITGWAGDCADYVFLPGTITEVCFSAIDDCGNASDEACITITVEECSTQFCTLTQGYYGNLGGLYCDGRTTTELLNDLLVTNLVVGLNANTFTIPAGASQCVIDILPGGGPSLPLSGALGCGNLGSAGTGGVINNSLLAQAITLGLNLRLDSDLANLEFTSPDFYVKESSGCGEADAYPVGDPIFYTGSNGMPASIMNLFGGSPTVMEIYNLANQALGGVAVTVPLGDITAALGKINTALDECAFIFFIPVLQSSPIAPEGSNDVMTLKVAPNPFNNEAIITYMVKTDSKITLGVYNMQGIRIATLYEGQASGGVVYTYKYTSTENTEQLIVIVLKSNYGTISERVIRIK